MLRHRLQLPLVFSKRARQLEISTKTLQAQIEQAIAYVKHLDDTETDTDTDTCESPLLEALRLTKLKLQRLAAEEKNRSWAMEGLARFGELLQTYKTLDEQANQMVRHLVKYLDANQGGFFLYTQDTDTTGHLDLIACYAYERHKHQQRRLHIDHTCAEGLLGQAFLEKATMHLTHLPDGYTRITSGLGMATPNSLLIVPLFNAEGTYGVLELASFHVFEEHQIRFVEKLSESIANSIASTLANEQTHKLLQVQQQQQQQLRDQEEELKRSLEKMNASHEDLKRVQQELEYTFEAVDTCFAAVELRPDGTVLKVNHVFCQLMGYAAAEITGKAHATLVDADYAASDGYRQFWAALNNGQFYSGEVERRAKDGRPVWLRATYYPLRNLDGHVTRIIKLGHDITEEYTQREQLARHQHLLAENERLLRERTKSVQEKAYQRIKDLKQQFQTDLDAKDTEISGLHQQLDTLRANIQFYQPPTNHD